MLNPGCGFLNEFVWRHDVTVLHGAVIMDALGILFRYAAFIAGARQALRLQLRQAAHYAEAAAGDAGAGACGCQVASDARAGVLGPGGGGLTGAVASLGTLRART